MLTIAPDLIEAMLEILQKTRWLQTALSVIELQQMIIQAIYLRVRLNHMPLIPLVKRAVT